MGDTIQLERPGAGTLSHAAINALIATGPDAAPDQTTRTRDTLARELWRIRRDYGRERAKRARARAAFIGWPVR
jgi:hypothetical protein